MEGAGGQVSRKVEGARRKKQQEMRSEERGPHIVQSLRDRCVCFGFNLAFEEPWRVWSQRVISDICFKVAWLLC